MILEFWREYLFGGFLLLLLILAIYLFHSGEVHCQNAVKLAEANAIQQMQKQNDAKQQELQHESDKIIQKSISDKQALQKQLDKVRSKSDLIIPVNLDFLHLYNSID